MLEYILALGVYAFLATIACASIFMVAKDLVAERDLLRKRVADDNAARVRAERANKRLRGLLNLHAVKN